MSPDSHQPVTLGRDCPGILIPSGRAVVLRRGEQVVVVQTLGGSFTVQTDSGHLARVDGHDAHALGLDGTEAVERQGEQGPDDAPFDPERVIEQLRTVFDPEIPINVVDLGLVYACDTRPLPGGGHRVEIKMSMTAPGCGMGDVLREDARSRVASVPGVAEVDVELVWDPPWDLGRMSEEARLQLGLW
ncbi:MAG: putative Fe-S cluster assembly protein SufT [Acidimicrobiales bacterium]